MSEAYVDVYYYGESESGYSDSIDTMAPSYNGNYVSLASTKVNFKGAAPTGNMQYLMVTSWSVSSQTLTINFSASMLDNIPNSTPFSVTYHPGEVVYSQLANTTPTTTSGKPLGYWKLLDDFSVPTNQFKRLPVHQSSTLSTERPNAAYWNTATPDTTKVKLELGKMYLVIPTVIWDVQSAGQRELSLIVNYSYTYEGPNSDDQQIRCQTLPGAAASYVEMTAAQIVIPELTVPATDIEVSLEVQVWQNSLKTVKALGLSSVAVYELDVVPEG